MMLDRFAATNRVNRVKGNLQRITGNPTPDSRPVEYDKNQCVLLLRQVVKYSELRDYQHDRAHHLWCRQSFATRIA